eukprot:COSAG01_NODE_13053_length_1644_cov_1.129450_2_plen_301_part_00
MASAMQLADVASEVQPGTPEAASLDAFCRRASDVFTESQLLSLTVPYGREHLRTTLLRFLRARAGDADASVQMLEECLQLRQQEDVDSILSRPLSSSVQQHLHSSFDEGWLPSPDRHGRPVYLMRGGVTGVRLEQLFAAPVDGMPWELEDVSEAFICWHLQMMEYLNKVEYAKRTAAAGRLINKFVIINDLSGMSTKGVTMIMKFADIMKRMAAVDQLLYPEGLGVMFFVNAPFAFRGPWKLIRSFMAEETRQRIHVLGADFQEQLHEVVEPAQLPPFLGGTLEGGAARDRARGHLHGVV